MVQRPKRLQIAALCHRDEGAKRRYLLITSRDTGRWIVPKGWPIKGLNSKETALQEAWEEAGVKRGKASKNPIGAYTYEKRQDTGWSFPVKTLVYSVSVKDLQDSYPEVHERNRKWVTAEEAANMVHEPELKKIFLAQFE
jgi:8-oxo-dGTP pyrophosphatase MutT (NUDIX family)